MQSVTKEFLEITIEIIAVVIAIEVCIFIALKFLRKKFQWIIFASDLYPRIDRKVLKKYFQLSFDRKLGWARKPNTTGNDKSPEGDAHFTISPNGSRANSLKFGGKAAISVYGDSFAFCRLVGDDETWPYFWSLKSGVRIDNFGVGNYGLDQALLRYELNEEDDAKIVVMAVVPETIVRIQSQWKHFFEYGNVLAFKPSFQIEGGHLIFRPSPIQSESDFYRLPQIIDGIKETDTFYKSKFVKDALRFPYSISFLRSWKRILRISAALLFSHKNVRKENAFQVVLKSNHYYQHELYENEAACQLLYMLVDRFVAKCKERNSKAVLVVLPQPLDMEDNKNGNANYRNIFVNMKEIVEVYDLTDLFLKSEDRFNIYKSGDLGRHTSRKMNEEIASFLFDEIKN